MDIAAGVILQYLRSLKKFPEWATVLVVVIVGGLSFWLSPAGGSIHDPRAFVQGMIPHILTVLGMTQATSTVANVAVSAGAPQSNPLVPVTDSL